MPLLRLLRLDAPRRGDRLTRWDGTRLTAHLEIRPHELTITLINLSGDAVTVRDSGLLLGRRRPPRELMIGFHADSECRAPEVTAGEATVCARVPIDLIRGLITRYKLRPSRLRARITLEDGRVIVSECLRPEHC
ncbi:MAG: hypothetical protein ABWZ77_06015 [Naasia sp.]